MFCRAKPPEMWSFETWNNKVRERERERESENRNTLLPPLLSSSAVKVKVVVICVGKCYPCHFYPPDSQ